MTKRCLLLLAHGTPSSLDELPSFLKNIRRGRPLPASTFEEVRRRYALIGGRSPLLDVTELQARLAGEAMGLPAFVATRMWHPYFSEVLQRLSVDGYEDALVVVMAAHSVPSYEAALRDASRTLRENGIEVPHLRVAPNWGNDPSLIACYAERAEEQLASIEPGDLHDTLLITTAHSIPKNTAQPDNDYPFLVRQTAELVVASLKPKKLRHAHAFQSQGMGGGDWWGPSVEETLQVAKRDGLRNVLLVPVGFLSDHVETLYDLDIEARAQAQQMGLTLQRSSCPNTHPKLIEAIVNVASKLL